MKGYKKMDEEIRFASLSVKRESIWEVWEVWEVWEAWEVWEVWEVRELRRWNLLERERQLK
jgi:hypothetical protein